MIHFGEEVSPEDGEVVGDSRLDVDGMFLGVE
jgi:hypothetical protein